MPKFFCRHQQQAHRGEEQAAQAQPQPQRGGEAVPPETPEGPQQRAEEAEKQHPTAQGAQDHVQPQLPIPKRQGEVEHRRQHRRSVEPVQQAAQPPARRREAEGPQQVVHQPQAQPQQDRGQKGRQLLGDLHPHQPNRRPSSPPLP